MDLSLTVPLCWAKCVCASLFPSTLYRRFTCCSLPMSCLPQTAGFRHINLHLKALWSCGVFFTTPFFTIPHFNFFLQYPFNNTLCYNTLGNGGQQLSTLEVAICTQPYWALRAYRRMRSNYFIYFELVKQGPRLTGVIGKALPCLGIEAHMYIFKTALLL